MFYQQLTLDELGILPEMVYQQMGYGQSVPDSRTVREVSSLLSEARGIARPAFCFSIWHGEVGPESLHLTGHDFQIGKIIARQMKGSVAFAFFVATAGHAFERWRKRGDILSDYLADALGSVIAERCADRMELSLQSEIASLGWNRTNRFSPGYCGWDVRDQHPLFQLLDPNPCGVVLNEAALMWPVKSVSGVIGLGPDVLRHAYTCHLCDVTHCYKRRG